MDELQELDRVRGVILGIIYYATESLAWADDFGRAPAMQPAWRTPLASLVHAGASGEVARLLPELQQVSEWMIRLYGGNFVISAQEKETAARAGVSPEMALRLCRMPKFHDARDIMMVKLLCSKYDIKISKRDIQVGGCPGGFWPVPTLHACY
jgi:hypothetical protein